MSVFQIPLISGRFFTVLGSNLDKVVINEKLATLMGFNNPLGQIMRQGEKKFQIIGIAKDFHYQQLSNDIHMSVIIKNARLNLDKVFIQFSKTVTKFVNHTQKGLADH